MKDWAAPAAQSVAVIADPQTFSAPLLPPLPSAIPRASFSSKPTLVTACPRNRYKTQTDQTLQPPAAQSIVPSASECAKPSGVSAVSSFRRRAKNRIAFSNAEETSGTEPDDANRPKQLPTSVESIGGGTNAKFSRVVGCGCGSCCLTATDRIGVFAPFVDADGTINAPQGTMTAITAARSFLLCFMVTGTKGKATPYPGGFRWC
mmetsp:Transcript_31715/g.75695  ORF Transcript_31715/g.75695 Transcript_31715/m.75695 type:complete len:205 (-) Transcript_31715:40-654(-)